MFLTRLTNICAQIIHRRLAPDILSWASPCGSVASSYSANTGSFKLDVGVSEDGCFLLLCPLSVWFAHNLSKIAGTRPALSKLSMQYNWMDWWMDWWMDACWVDIRCCGSLVLSTSIMLTTLTLHFTYIPKPMFSEHNGTFSMGIQHVVKHNKWPQTRTVVCLFMLFLHCFTCVFSH